MALPRGHTHELRVLLQLPHHRHASLPTKPSILYIRDCSQLRSCRIFDTKDLAYSMGKLRSKDGWFVSPRPRCKRCFLANHLTAQPDLQTTSC